MVDMSTPSTTTTHATAPHGAKTLAWLLVGAAALIVAYWTTWFLVPGGRDFLATLPTDHSYLAFENAFPIADGWLAVCGITAATQLFRGKSSAIAWVFMTGGAGMYLGGMDVLFDIQNKVYASFGMNPSSIGAEIAINVLTVALSIGGMWWAKINTAWLAKG